MDFSWWQGLVAGGVATVAMTLLMQVGAAMGMSSMSMALMLGSMFRRSAGAARALGWPLHLVNGLAFGVLYALVWWLIDPATWRAPGGSGSCSAPSTALSRS